MSTRDIARERLAAVMEQHSTGVVTVVSGTESAEGFQGVLTAEAGLTDYGEQGDTDGLVRVSLGDLTKPTHGATITVDGVKVWVTHTRPDPIEATLTIAYTTQTPVEGI